ncbi:AAA family ATPase, partial [Patescibacteria group bacterium]|nr:AAA family ATPase [Patescibacteria group bacterium]
MISFKSIKIQNYKGFVDSGEIKLCVPDGVTSGSGLNIFVGENGSGKTSVLQALNLLTAYSSSIQNKTLSSDFNNSSSECDIQVTATLSNELDYQMVAPWKQTFKVKAIKTVVKHRDQKTPQKLLSSKFTYSNIVEPNSRTHSWYRKGLEPITDFYLGLDNDRFINNESIHIFYFDRNRERQSKKGYSTTFSRVMDDFNWKFYNSANHVDVLTKWNEFYPLVVSDDIGSKVKDMFKTLFNSNLISKVRLELLSLNEPYSEAFLGIPSDSNLTQIALSELGSGVDLLYSILFIKQIAEQSKGSIIFCIDEPELSLHPQWQKILFELFKEEAKTKQIFISTHSPHFIDATLLKNVKKFTCDESGTLTITNLSETVANDLKTQSLFNLENREIFFCESVILAEGWEDKDRIRKFLNSNNNDIFVMVGLQNFERVKNVCKELGIKFKAIVDLDYLRNEATLIPDLTKDELNVLEEVRALDEIISSSANEIIKKEANKIKSKIETDKLCILSSKIKSKMDSNSTYAKKVKAKIDSLKITNTFVLPNGVIEDYLDEEGKEKSDALFVM